jgi:hypothetical protein
MLLRDAFWKGRAESQAVKEDYERTLRLHQLEGKAPVGPFGEVVRIAFSHRVDLCREQLQALKIAGLQGWERIRIGGAEEVADADQTLPAIILEVPMHRRAGDTIVRVSLRGTINVSPRRDASIHCIARNSGAGPRDFLAGFLGAIALAAIGETNRKHFDAIAVGGAEDETEPSKLMRRLQIPSREQARSYLSALAEDLFSGANHYFLPIEAVEKIFDKTGGAKTAKTRVIWAAIEDVRDNDFAHCRSDFGPIRNARTYTAPPPAAVREIIKRRFDLIRAIFGA